jgi:hypothetical protein
VPCFTIRTTSLHLSKLDQDLLKKALEGLGYAVTVHAQQGLWVIGSQRGNVGTFQTTTGKLISQSGTFTEQQVRQAYGQAAIKVAAERFGWKVASGKKANQYVLSRRK